MIGSMNTAHLDALNLRLSHERSRLAAAKSQKEKTMRAVWVAGIEKEIAQERVFLGLTDVTEVEMTDDELLAELMG